MMMKAATLCIALLQLLAASNALQTPRIDRRSFMASSAAAVLFTPLVSIADDDNLAATLYNEDGSLRDDISKEAKERVVSFSWDVQEQGVTQVDGKSDSTGGSQVNLCYNLPEKWISNEKGLYIDPSEGVNAKAADHILVYQAPGKVDPKQLQKASTMGVGKALQVIPALDRVNGADLIGGRKSAKGEDGQLYYEFDLASAPKTCDASSNQNLGLGFCPYDRIFLLSATVTAEGRLYVLAVECDNLEWKQASADLKRVRSSFTVEPVAAVAESA